MHPDNTSSSGPRSRLAPRSPSHARPAKVNGCSHSEEGFAHEVIRSLARPELGAKLIESRRTADAVAAAAATAAAAAADAGGGGAAASKT